jgi:hypothetical protein
LILLYTSDSIQQNNIPNWTNSQLMRQFTNTIGSNVPIADSYIPQPQPPMPSQEMQITPESNSIQDKKVQSNNYLYANGYPVIYSNPLPQPPPPPPQVILAPVPAPVVPVGPYPVQQPIVSAQGDVIVENTIGGIPFDCRGRPTGHWRDTRFCDIFHACVHGYQRKTYACPIVGERTYFDEITKRCEFISKNPLGCTVNVFLK